MAEHKEPKESTGNGRFYAVLVAATVVLLALIDMITELVK